MIYKYKQNNIVENIVYYENTTTKVHYTNENIFWNTKVKFNRPCNYDFISYLQYIQLPKHLLNFHL